MATVEIYRLLTSLFGRERLCFTSERVLQDEIEKRLKVAKVDYTREHRLDVHNRPDFLINRTGIEVKIQGGLTPILRQLKRYADDPAIDGLILITSKRFNVPESLSTKPLYAISLWRNLL